MRTIKIGSASDCEIWFDAFSRKNSVWAIIEADEKGILILHRIDDSVRCFVNDNEVADKYLIRFGDKVIINGFRLDWQLITQLLNGYSAVQRNRVKPTPCVYGPPIPSYHEEKSIRSNHIYIEKQSISSNRSSKLGTKVRWKVVSLIIAVLGAIIGVSGIIFYGPRLLDEKSINQPLLYGPSLLNQEEQEKIRQMQEQIEESLDSLSELQTTPSPTEE